MDYVFFSSYALYKVKTCLSCHLSKAVICFMRSLNVPPTVLKTLWIAAICQQRSLFLFPLRGRYWQVWLYLYRVAQKECNDFDPLFQRHSWLNTIDFCCIGEHILFQVIWHQVHQVWIRRFDSSAIFLRQCHFQNVLLFPPQAGLKQREFFNLTASHWISCVDKT